ncbi:UNVERIFIED_CONTAM: hypothetical protein B566_EDAN018921 [Ephemera danica]|nr:hypothetical protein B566_EDAN018921 [Ephemera danica]
MNFFTLTFRALGRNHFASTSSDDHRKAIANFFPKVTNPICRLPLLTLFYQLEAFHLGDLMRLWVRFGLSKGHQMRPQRDPTLSS